MTTTDVEPAVTGPDPIAPALARVGLAEHIDALRRTSPKPLDPWPEPRLPVRPGSWAMELLHRGQPVPSPRGAALLRTLCSADLARGEGTRLMPGRWQVTAFRGALVVRDRAPSGQLPEVYLGEDGLRFAASVADARPRGSVLELGCGAGLATSVAAQTAARVVGIDVVPASLEATALSSRLNGLASRVSAEWCDLRALGDPGPVDVVMGNLPGVPVAPPLVYATAGDGGADGFALLRPGLEVIRGALGRRPASTDAVRLVMRVQSLSTDDQPFVLSLLRSLAEDCRLDLVVTADSRMPIELRNGLTARYAEPLNPSSDPADLLRRIDDHAAALGATSYVSVEVIGRDGTGRVAFVDATSPVRVTSRLVVTRPTAAGVDQVAAHYLARLGQLPMAFWEFAGDEVVSITAARARRLWTAFGEGASVREAVDDVFADLAPADRRAVLATTACLADALTTAGLAVPRHDSPRATR